MPTSFRPVIVPVVIHKPAAVKPKVTKPAPAPKTKTTTVTKTTPTKTTPTKTKTAPKETTSEIWASTHQPQIQAAQTLHTYKTFSDAIGKGDLKTAQNLAQANYNAAVAGLTPESQLQADSAQQESNVTGLGNTLLQQLGGIQVANASGQNLGIGLFNQAAGTGNNTANSQVISAGGVPESTLDPAAAATLATVAANNSNIYGGKEAAAAEQNRLYGAQVANNLVTALANRQSDVTKAAAQIPVDTQNELNSLKTQDASKLSNLLTTNLYTSETTAKTATDAASLAEKKREANQTADIKRDQFISDATFKEANLKLDQEKVRLQSEGLSTKQVNTQAKAYEQVLLHGQGGTSSGGAIKYKITSTYPKSVTNPLTGQSTTEVATASPVTVDADHYAQYLKSVAAGHPNVALLGLPQGAQIQGQPVELQTSTGKSQPWTYQQKMNYLVLNGYSEAGAMAALGPKPVKTVTKAKTKVTKPKAKVIPIGAPTGP